MLNKVQLIGHLGADPQAREMKTGKVVCSFSLATSEKWGEEKKTEWHRISVWEKLAEVCMKYLKKGSLIYVEGRIHYRKYEKDGVEVPTTEIIANQIKFLPSKDSGSENRNDKRVSNLTEKEFSARQEQHRQWLLDTEQKQKGGIELGDLPF